MQIPVMENILEKNDQLALEVNAMLTAKGIFTLNLMGSPGSGKTSLLEKTIMHLKTELRMAIIEGDLFTSKDADRIACCEVPVIQINTSGGCHLDANMVKDSLASLDLDNLDVIIVENVGNLVCPAEFNIGEDKKATVLSITEGEDKPMKYPLMFKQASVVLLNKIDLLPYTSFDAAAARADIGSLNPAIRLVEVSCRTEEGLLPWYDWIREEVAAKKKGYKGSIQADYDQD